VFRPFFIPFFVAGFWFCPIGLPLWFIAIYFPPDIFVLVEYLRVSLVGKVSPVTVCSLSPLPCAHPIFFYSGSL